jgi:hypothetical protein
VREEDEMVNRKEKIIDMGEDMRGERPDGEKVTGEI